MSELTTERLEKRIKNCIEVGNGCVMLPVSMAEELLAYRKTVNHLLDNDGSRGKFSAVQSYDAREDLERLLAVAQQNEPQNIPAQPVITERHQMVPDERPADSSNGNDAEAWFDEGWNACRAEMLKAQPVSEPYKFPDNLDFDCEFENGDYDIDEEPWLRGRVDGFNEALQIIKRSLNAKQNSTAQESE